jgi:hypothetical protein
MTVGLPGTGIGGIFYLLLALCMPVTEFVRTLKGRTNLKRWFFIALQLLFVFGVVAVMWSELWLLNKSLALVWGALKVNSPLIVVDQAFRQTKVMAMASASASFISLTFVVTGVHVLRFFVHRGRRRRNLTIPESRPPLQILNPPSFTPVASQWKTTSVLNQAPSAA